MFRLSTLLEFDEIVVQCHDNPDADTIASGYGLYCYFKSYNKSVKLIYSGNIITKPNIILMIELLKIPLEHVNTLKKTNLLITIDCQYGQANVTKFSAENICIIDHHVTTNTTSDFSCVYSNLASCSTLIWTLLNNENFPLNDTSISTALYYGLLTDSNNFSELYNEYDRAMKDSLVFDIYIIKQLINSNLSLNDLTIAGLALLNCKMNKKNRFATFKSDPCDPNILGFISDLAIQVDTIDTCIVYFENDDGIKFSIRSCNDKPKATELAAYLSKNYGSSGGHGHKAGGFISAESFYKIHKSINMSNYINNKTEEFFLYIN